MSVLLARTADRLYWGGRYLERAEDTARIVRSYSTLVFDYDSDPWSWEPLVALSGSAAIADGSNPREERTVLRYLIADPLNPSSIRSSVASARENLRATREVMPREAWQAVNSLSRYVGANADNSVERQLRDHFLNQVIQHGRQLDGVIESTMSRGNGWRMMRLGRLLERADMTTRVLGVAAYGILFLERTGSSELVNEQVRWMSVLRSVSALQMYHRSVRRPIDGAAVVRFLLDDTNFPRSVTACLEEAKWVAAGLPDGADLVAGFDDTIATVNAIDVRDPEGQQLDRAMDAVQLSIADMHRGIIDRYVAARL